MAPPIHSQRVARRRRSLVSRQAGDEAEGRRSAWSACFSRADAGEEAEPEPELRLTVLGLMRMTQSAQPIQRSGSKGVHGEEVVEAEEAGREQETERGEELGEAAAAEFAGEESGEDGHAGGGEGRRGVGCRRASRGRGCGRFWR